MTEQLERLTVGRYLLHRKIARGGMATIHIARLMGDVGFSRIVAAKRMHPDLAEDADFVAMFLDEARIASKVNHRNVVPVLDVVTLGEEVMIVQEYVHGAPLSVLLRTASDASSHVPIPVAASIACQVLAGLHAAHETVDEMGTPLQIVHRDVSPQNIMISHDGTARLLDFGVAKAAVGAHVTRKGTFKGKLGYSSPEQIRGEATRQSDIYSLGVVLWELLVGHRMHGTAQGEAELIAEIMAGRVPTITEALAEERSWIGAYRWSQLEALEPIIRKSLDVTARRRWATAADMEEAIAAAVPLASATDVAAWLKAVGRDFLDDRERMIAAEEESWRRAVASLASSAELPALEIPISTATEPDGTPPPNRWRARGPTAIIAALGAALIACVAFLLRDLDGARATERPRGARSQAAPATPAVQPTALTPTTPAPSTAPSPMRPAAGSVAPGPELRAAPPPPVPADVATSPRAMADPEPPRASRERARQVETSRPSRRSERAAAASRPPPPRPAPATPPSKPATAAPALDCTTPFYFEGRKKIFKPGCL